MGVNKTKGHIAGSAGLRGHSVGSVFPFVIMLMGNPARHYVQQPNGVRVGPFKSYDEAEFWAGSMEVDRQMGTGRAARFNSKLEQSYAS